MTTHVFIVNDDTFLSHLQYLFAGTGAYSQKKKVWVDEHIGLLSDIKRVRPDDLVIFYIEATKKVKGGFYGIFKIADQSPIVFHTPGANGLQPNLPKTKLIYRTLIEPFEVYSEGVPEYEALDKLPIYATEIQWSLIYRKLKGKRGCTPLLPWEAKRLMEMIRNKNSGNSIANDQFTGGFDWDVTNRRIIVATSRTRYSYPRNFTFNVVNSICRLQRQREKRAYETHLQLYFTENLGINKILTPIVGTNIVWFGNEVACGVGMQKIDILTICQDKEKRVYRIIELKDEPVTQDVVEQIEYYVNWASQKSGRHLDGAFDWNLQPVIVAPEFKKKTKKDGSLVKKWQKIIYSFNSFNNKHIAKPVQYFEYKCQDSNIIFNEINY